MTIRYAAEDLREFVAGLFRAAGLPDEDARVCADAFVLQEMRGVKTHGLRRLRQRVLDVAEGRLNANPQRRVLQESGATVIIDADSGVGILGCMDAMERAIALSKKNGLGFAVVVNSNHFLAAAPYCIRAAEAGVIGIALANGHSSMAYPGTNVGALGNSPMGFGLPTGAGFPIVFDAALTMSGGRMLEWRDQAVSIPDGFLGYDAGGSYTSDPGAILDGGVPLPIGLHKGAGLAIMFDILTGVIGGSGFLRTLLPEGREEWRWTRNAHSFLALDIAHFMPLDIFRERMAAYVADLKDKPLAPGHEEILLPGERAARSIEDCRLHGVPIEDDILRELSELSQQFSIPLPS
jgi:LDH2 family malate/lactate/ureidoglycolate dehydrogenase